MRRADLRCKVVAGRSSFEVALEHSEDDERADERDARFNNEPGEGKSLRPVLLANTGTWSLERGLGGFLSSDDERDERRTPGLLFRKRRRLRLAVARRRARYRYSSEQPQFLKQARAARVLLRDACGPRAERSFSYGLGFRELARLQNEQFPLFRGDRTCIDVRCRRLLDSCSR